MTDTKKVFETIDRLEEKYIKILEEFCLIESPTDYKKGVDDASEYIVKIAESFGWKVERQVESVAGDAFCITMNPDAKGAPVCLSGHVDTVHPVGLFGTPAVKLDGEKIYGPGVADCKGGIISALLAMAALCEENYTDRPIKLILQSDEETSSAESNKRTVRFMCDCARGAVAFLNCEPATKGTAVIKRKGIAKYVFKVTGRAAHASICYTGISAIAEASHKILELEKLKDKDGITANCGLISGGTKINTVPEECTFKVDFRFSNDEELKKVQEIAKKVADTSFIEGSSCELTLASLRDAMPLSDTNLALLENVNKIFEKVNLSALNARSAGGGSDAAYTTNCGIPTLDSLGIEGANFHSKNEYATLSSLKDSAMRLAAICLYI